MRSARIPLVRALGWSWMGMACAACVPWLRGCGTGMRLVLAGNGPDRDFLPVLLGLGPGGPVPAAQPGTRHERGEGSRAALRRCPHRAAFDTRTGKSPGRRPART